MAIDGSETWHPLRTLLHVNVASDAQAVEYLPHTVATLSEDALAPSSHLSKWTTRVTSLLHAKDGGARWAGLCLALKTAQLSKTVLTESAQVWLSASLPMLARNDPAASHKAAARLTYHIFLVATDMPEFQRQVATPNVPKFTQALVQLLDAGVDAEGTVLYLDILTRLVPLYPTLHRALYASLSALCMRILNESAEGKTTSAISNAAANFYAVLPFTGGKGGAANLWRTALDENIAFTLEAFGSLRTTIARGTSEARSQHPDTIPTGLGIGRLRCGVAVLVALLRTNTARAVQVPIGGLCHLGTVLLGCTLSDQREALADPVRHAQEMALVPSIWLYGCELVQAVVNGVENYITPYAGQLLSYISYHLEQPGAKACRLTFLSAAHTILSRGLSSHDALVLARLAKTVLPLVTILLGDQTEVPREEGATSSRKGKKRARAYEGDELLKTGRDMICHTVVEGQTILAAVQVLSLLERNGSLPAPVQSLVARVFLSVHLALQQFAPSALSADPSLHGRLAEATQHACMSIGVGSTGVMSKAASLILHGVASSSDPTLRDQIELLIHPRLPAIIRPLPHVEHLSLFRTEEGDEEGMARAELGLDLAPAPTPVSATSAALPGSQTSAGLAAPQNAEVRAAQPTYAPPLPLASAVSVQPATTPLSHTMASAATTPSQSTGSSLPPPPEPLPSTSTSWNMSASTATMSASTGNPALGVAVPATRPADAMSDENASKAALVTPARMDVDEEMPDLDLGSDSEGE